MDRIHQRDCVECGTRFEPKRSDARYCSARCRVRHNRRDPQPEPQPVTDGPGAITSGPAVTERPLTVCRCDDCRERAEHPIGYWDRVVRTLAVEQAKSPIATYELEWGARCDYCGRIFDPAKCVEQWEDAGLLDDGTEIVRTGTYCSEPCGRDATRQAGSVRG